MSTDLKAGISITDISPKPGLPLGGYPHYPRYNEGIHDPLYASCLYIEDGETEIVLAAMDILFFSKKYVSEVRKRVFIECGIPEKNIMISCSHTHSGPWAAGGVDEETMSDNEDAEYVTSLKDKLVRMIVEAKEKAFDAKIGITKGYCGPEQGIGGNRRDPEGPADTDICVVAVKDMSDEVRGIYMIYALHPTVIHEDSNVVSADFPGYTRKYLKEAFPKAEVIYAQGASGNQSSRYFRQGQSFSEAERIGFAIGTVTKEIIEKTKFKREIKLDLSSSEIPILTREVPPMHELEKVVCQYKKRYETLKSEDAPYIEIQNANLRYLGAEDLMNFVKAYNNGKLRLLYEEDPAEIQVIRIGDTVIAGLPGEIFVEFALEIKKQPKYENFFVATLTNGCLPGYVCTKESYAIGGYETGASFLSPEFGYIMLEKVIELIEGLE